MKPGLVVGLRQETELTVTPALCPHFDGVLIHPVLATWNLVHAMEVCGRRALAPYLEPHEEGVGARISVEHRGMAAIDAIVRVRADVQSVSARQLSCRMTAWHDQRLLAEGDFVQIILPREKLARLLSEAQAALR